jgi:hypothetical protein
MTTIQIEVRLTLYGSPDHLGKLIRASRLVCALDLQVEFGWFTLLLTTV